ncbi:MAG: hypothetical protein E6I57_07010 [Chloroflexi bacterium]|nr:MAG: hypothetical protein E6I57_07010 [Chloroflexota bacterium]
MPVAQAMGGRRWYTVPDGLIQEKALVAVAMAADALPGQPRARLRETGATVPLSFIVAPRVGNQWSGSLDLAGAAPGEQTVDFLVRMRDGSDRVVASSKFFLHDDHVEPARLDDHRGQPREGRCHAAVDDECRGRG